MTTATKRRRKAKSSDSTSIWLVFLKENLIKIIIWFFSGVVMIVGFYFSPLKDYTFHLIWKEKVQIKLIPDNKKISLGDAVTFQLAILPMSKIEVSNGICEIQFEKNFFILQTGNTSFNIKTLDEPYFVPEVKEIKLKTINEGTTFLKVHYQTRFGSYKDSTKVIIQPTSSSNKPSISNFSGIWKIKLGFLDGQIELIDRDGTLNGSYILQNGENGTITGLRDGSTFLVDLIRKGELVKWHVKANWKPNNDFIEITGKSLLLNIVNNEWEPLNNDELDFYSAVKL